MGRLRGSRLGMSIAVLAASTALSADVPGVQETEPEGRAAGGRELWQPAPGTAPAESFDPEFLTEIRTRAEERGDPADWLAFGAALLHTGDWQGGIPPLRRALESRRPEEREDAAYDLALAYAVAGAPGTAAGTSGAGSVARAPSGEESVVEDPGTPRDRLLRARDGFRAVLRADSAAEDARWNLELVERWLEEQGGGGDSSSGGGAASGDPQEGGGGESAPMTREEAQSLLDAAADMEREVQARRLERNQERDPRLDRNW